VPDASGEARKAERQARRAGAGASGRPGAPAEAKGREQEAPAPRRRAAVSFADLDDGCDAPAPLPGQLTGAVRPPCCRARVPQLGRCAVRFAAAPALLCVVP